ncbi:hypothetical protein V6N11_065133 [Hibiscus sabdariffa]|uniref:Reverse transcriptase Ty1/copia-type domain-containing protein n=1 Tax=Hibiscus sabdariffa TaxID=183260 RepID=A0ABR2SJV9_9ROSI
MPDDAIVTPVPLDNLPRQPNVQIATPVPLADPPQQGISPDLPQQAISYDLPQQVVSSDLPHDNNTGFISHFTNILSTKFALKDMGLLSQFLDIEAITTSTGLFLSQAQYISGILT